jgi:hypothetical protein
MNIRLVRGLPFVSASLTQNGKALELDQVLLDTGSQASVFSADELWRLDVRAEPGDRLMRVAGVGGTEFVFSKRMDAVTLGGMELRGFEIQIGDMSYGFPIQGIIGMDFLLQVHAKIDLGKLEILDGR